MDVINERTAGPMGRRRWLSVPLVLLGLGGCQAFGPPDLSVSRERLQQQLARQFPRQQRLLELLDVYLEVPQLDLQQAGPGRFGLRLPVQIRERLGGSLVDGVLGFTAQPRWDAAERGISLSQVRVTALELQRQSARPPAWLQQLGSVVAERLLEGLVVYRVEPQQLDQLRRWGWRPAGITIGADSLRVELAPLDGS